MYVPGTQMGPLVFIGGKRPSFGGFKPQIQDKQVPGVYRYIIYISLFVYPYVCVEICIYNIRIH